MNYNFIYHTMDIYMPAINMPLKCHTFAIHGNYLKCRNETTMSEYPPDMNSMQWKCDHDHWHTYIRHHWHMPLNKYVCHTAYVSHYIISTVVYILTQHSCTHLPKINKCATYIKQTTAKYFSWTDLPLNCNIYAICLITWYACMGELCKYMSQIRSRCDQNCGL